MGFSYDKPLSIEQIFSMFNSNGGEKIDKEEAANAKNVSIFNGFIVEEDMTLEDFESKNNEIYEKYELTQTEAWAEKAKDSADPKEQDAAYKALFDVANRRKEKAKELLNADIKKSPVFGLDETPASIHVIGQEDPDGKKPKEGDYAVKDNKTFKYENGEWKEIKTQ